MEDFDLHAWRGSLAGACRSIIARYCGSGYFADFPNQFLGGGNGHSYCALAAEVRRLARSRVLLVVDQFEEVFAPAVSESDLQALFGNLLDASSLVSGKITVVVVLRADFYAQVAAYPDLADRISARQMIITPMQEGDLWEAITRPAAQSGLGFEDGLDEAILREMHGQAGALPLLQQAAS